MKKFVLTILLALIFASMLAYVFIYERGPSKADKEKEPATVSVIEVPESAIKSVEINNTGRILLVKNGDKWRIAAPVDARTKDGSMDGIIGVLKKLDAQTLVSDNAENLADFGLDNPDIEVFVEKVDGMKLSLLIGDKIPVGNSNYMMLEDSRTVYAISHDDVAGLEKSIEDLRDDSIADDFEEKDVVSISVESGESVKMCLKRSEIDGIDGQQATTEKEGEESLDDVLEEAPREELSNWYFAARPEQSCDQSAEELLNELGNGTAIGFVDEIEPDLVPLGLDYPRYKFNVGFSDGSDWEFEIGKGIKSRYYTWNKVRNEIYEVDESFIEKLEGMKMESARIE